MVAKKKRPPPAIEASDSISKKSKPSEAAGTSSGTSVVSTPKVPKRGGGSAAKNKIKTEEVQESNPCGTDGCPSKSPKRGGGSNAKAKVKIEDDVAPEQEEVPENNQCGSEDFPDWSPSDLLELMKQMERVLPSSDSLRHSSRVEKLNWDSVSFGCHSAEECKKTWLKIQLRLRRFRLLREILEDAKVWASKPWTNFYRSQKLNRHPDMPRRPLSTYMLFYMATKDKVSKEHPHLDMTELSRYIADMYNSLTEKKKKKYTEMAAVQRKVYEEKLNLFYHEHPELVPKQDKHDSRGTLPGPKRPLTPFKLFFEDKLKRHESDPNLDKNSFKVKCKGQWKNLPDKKKVIWINWASEEETRYTEELKAYMSENPAFEPAKFKPVLTKEEKVLRSRVAGKPKKPPNSGYSLFSRLMLASDHMKDVAPKERMLETSRMWKNMPETQKKKYQERVNHMLDQYKLEYATYLESLPEDKRKEELQSNMPKARKPAQPKVAKAVEGKKTTRTKVSKHPKNETPGLYKGEPDPPPRNEYELFVKALLLQDKNQTNSEKTAPKIWQMLPDSDKLKYRKKLSEIKTKYIQDYEKFLNSLSQEELKEYSARKENSKKEHVDASEESAKEEDSSSSDDSDDDDQESGSDDSSSDSESSSSDSSESNDGDSKNSGDSSSSVSDSD